jgi:hypothetical protein
MIGFSSMPLSVSDLESLTFPKPWTITKFVDNCWNVSDADGNFIAYVVTISQQDVEDLFNMLAS